MHIALVCGLFLHEQKDDIIANSKGVIQYAADALQWSFVDGIKNNSPSKITVINLPYIGSYPHLYRKNIIKKSFFGEKDGINGVSPCFCNFILYKNYSKYKSLKNELLKWTQESLLNRVVVIYAVHIPFLKAVEQVKRIYPDLKIVLIVPDLPEFMNDKKTVAYALLKKISKRLLDVLYTSVDGYVLLTKYMVEKIPVGNKPYVVVEGIFNFKDDISIDAVESSELKTVFYSGTLARRYGIMTLVKAFTALKNENYRLLICGNGDALGEIVEYSKLDNRIVYGGQLSRTKILELQKKATLLVNPRSNEWEFTKYSFPSKTIEYLASGTPTLLCKLPGIPDEYYNYCFALDSMIEESLRDKINDILLMDKDRLLSFGNEARSFILQQKNSFIQCSKVMDLIYTINN